MVFELGCNVLVDIYWVAKEKVFVSRVENLGKFMLLGGYIEVEFKCFF